MKRIHKKTYDTHYVNTIASKHNVYLDKLKIGYSVVSRTGKKTDPIYFFKGKTWATKYYKALIANKSIIETNELDYHHLGLPLVFNIRLECKGVIIHIVDELRVDYFTEQTLVKQTPSFKISIKNHVHSFNLDVCIYDTSLKKDVTGLFSIEYFCYLRDYTNSISNY